MIGIEWDEFSDNDSFNGEGEDSPNEEFSQPTELESLTHTELNNMAKVFGVKFGSRDTKAQKIEKLMPAFKEVGDSIQVDTNSTTKPPKKASKEPSSPETTATSENYPDASTASKLGRKKSTQKEKEELADAGFDDRDVEDPDDDIGTTLSPRESLIDAYMYDEELSFEEAVDRANEIYPPEEEEDDSFDFGANVKDDNSNKSESSNESESTHTPVVKKKRKSSKKKETTKRNPSNSGAKNPPNKPPAPPTVPPSEPPFDDEDDNLPDDEPVPETQDPDTGEDQTQLDVPNSESELRRRQREADRLQKKLQDKEFQDIKRREAQQRRRIAAERTEKNRLKTAARRSEKEKAKKEIDALKTTTTSDRIVRRLASFGIGRSLGGSGQSFAAIMELGVFSPQERAENEAIEKAKIESKERLDAIERTDKETAFQEKYTELETQFEGDQLAADKKFQLDNPENPEDREEALRDFEIGLDRIRERKAEKTAPKIIPESDVPQPSSTDESSSSNYTPSSSQPTGSGGSIPPTVPPTNQGTPGKPDSSNNPFTDLFQGVSKTTAVLLGANIAIEQMTRVSEAFSGAISDAKNYLAVDPQSAASPAFTSAVSAGGEVVKTGASAVGAGVGYATGIGTTAATAVGSTVVGATAGTSAAGVGAAVAGTVGAAAGPLGIAIGAAVGGALGGMVVDPVVSAIDLTNSILNSMVETSIGIQTISARADQQLLTALKALDVSDSVDPITADYVMAQGELNRALLDLKESLIKGFGPEFNDLITLVAGLTTKTAKGVDTMSLIYKLIEIGTTKYTGNEERRNQLINELLNQSASTADNTQAIADAFKELENNKAVAEIEEFFKDQTPFQNLSTDFTKSGTSSFFR